LKRITLYLRSAFFSGLQACSPNEKAVETQQEAFNPPQRYAANFDADFSHNPRSGDRVRPLYDLKGDTLVTGKTFPVIRPRTQSRDHKKPQQPKYRFAQRC